MEAGPNGTYAFLTCWRYLKFVFVFLTMAYFVSLTWSNSSFPSLLLNCFSHINFC